MMDQFLFVDSFMANVIYAPHPFDDCEQLTVFLAGSIEMGAAQEWQKEFIKRFSDLTEITFLNPRRPDWDSSWGPYNPELYKQIHWEQKGIKEADLVVYFFDPETKSPVTLMELGQRLGGSSPRSIVVGCPDGYWRKSNVVITCAMYDVDVFDSLNETVAALAAKIRSYLP